jgi:hypothetical protein
MPCHEPSTTAARRSALRRVAKILLTGTALALTGCGGQLGNSESQPSGVYVSPGSRLLATMLGMKPTGAANDAPAPAQPNRHIFCPQIVVLEGAAASRAYAGSPPASENLRYQSALTDTARECALEGDKLAIKIGVAGNVLLGPAGSAGSFSVPVRMTILRKRDNEPVAAKLYRAAVTVGPGQTQADFTIISDPLYVPFIQDHAEDDYTISVGISEGAEGDEKARRRGATH